MDKVSFDTSVTFPTHVFAETMRFTKGSPVNFEIRINEKFEEHFQIATSQLELNRLRFVLAVTIFHEVLHLCLRNLGIITSPAKLIGINGLPEAGEFGEFTLFHGVITMRLSNSEGGVCKGWNPATMTITAVVLML